MLVRNATPKRVLERRRRLYADIECSAWVALTGYGCPEPRELSRPRNARQRRVHSSFPNEGSFEIQFRARDPTETWFVQNTSNCIDDVIRTSKSLQNLLK